MFSQYKNEKVVGQGIAEWLASDSKNRREELFVTSKVRRVWNSRGAVCDLLGAKKTKLLDVFRVTAVEMMVTWTNV
jgi:diketogulonate reductase-like aldo/keto reductase